MKDLVAKRHDVLQIQREQSNRGAPFMVKQSMSFSGIENKCDEVHGEDELSDDGVFQCGEKKKRLNLEQVKALEKSSDLANKL
ncbi:hypothetical protein JHK84_050080 [Glycine max]|nr:hypothetical protein JHK85_050807 [Glycine max]KAG5094492.1 hypothetical protein JHK84_050080 [Glycine max]